MKVANKYLSSTQWIFHYYKDLGDKTLAQINEQQLHWQCNTTTNSIAIIPKCPFEKCVYFYG